METIEEINENFDVKKPKKKGALITVIAIIAVLIALIATYFIVFTKPQFIFTKAIDKIFDVQEEEYDSIKLDYKIKGNVETEDYKLKEQLAEVEKYTLELGTQMDISGKKEIVDLGLDYNSEEVIKAQLYYDNEELYAYFDGIFDKYINLEMEEEQKEQLEEIFEKLNSEEEKEKTKKIAKILKDEIKTQIKEEGKFEKTKETIEIDGKEKKVTKNTLVLSQKTLIKMFSNMFSNLAKNDEFIECVESDTLEEDTIKDGLEEVAAELKELDEEEEIINIKINIYTKGILNKFVGFDIETEVNMDYQKIKVIAEIIKETKNVYSYKVKMKSQGVNVEAVNGKIEIQEEKNTKQKQEGKLIITAEVAEMIAPIKGKLEVDYSAEFNNGIDKIDVSNSVKMDEITEKEIETIMQELKTRPLIGDFLTSMDGGLFEQAQTAAEETEKHTILEEMLSVAMIEMTDEMKYDYNAVIAKMKQKYTVEYTYPNAKITGKNGTYNYIVTETEIKIADEEENQILEEASDAANRTKKAQIQEAIALTKAEFLAAYYSQEIKLEEITEEKVKEAIEEYLYEPYNIKVTKTPGKLEFIITVEGIELDEYQNKIDLSSLNTAF